MSHYADYLHERTHDRIIECTSGFVTYRYINDGKTVYVIDIYTVPGMRKAGRAAALADMVAEEARGQGAAEMLGTVVPSTKGSSASAQVLFAYGMTLHSAGNDIIVFRKDL